MKRLIIAALLSLLVQGPAFANGVAMCMTQTPTFKPGEPMVTSNTPNAGVRQCRIITSSPTHGVESYYRTFKDGEAISFEPKK